MPETPDTHKEIVKIRRDIEDIKRSQEADMQLNRQNYERLVYLTLGGNETRVKVFLAVDGLKSRKDIQDEIGKSQTIVWFAVDHLERYGLILKLENTKAGSPVYGKPRWIHALRIDDYVKEKFPIKPKEQPKLPDSST